MTDAIRVMCVDDHQILREGVAAILMSEPDMDVVGQASGGVEAVSLFKTLRPDVTLMDIQMPDMDGIETMKAIRDEFSEARIVMLTTYAGDVRALAALKAGAVGYLLKTMLRRELIDTIRGVHAGRRVVPHEVASQIAEHVADSMLSKRELEILQSLSLGNSNRMIGEQLGISTETVKAHMRSLMSKLGAEDRTQALLLALRRGIIEL